VLVGVDPFVPEFGFGGNGSAIAPFEIDTLTGGQGSDTFLLGDPGTVLGIQRGNPTPEVYYVGGENSDYALITDFTAGEDRIQLRADHEFSGYSFGATSSGIGISFNNDLIAIVEGVSFFELFSTYNNFVLV
jgi:Ca2+-binding RTX toxin-like protein